MPNRFPYAQCECIRTSTFSLPATSPWTSASVRFRADVARIENGAEIAEFGGEAAFGAPVHVMFVAQTVADQVGDRDHFQAVPRAEFAKLRHARHGAVLIHDFADHARGVESGEAGKIDGRFRLSGAHQHAAFARAQGKDVAGAREIAGPRVRVDGCEDGSGAVRR